jgi:transcriptional regulator with XRE-family HTH domain
MLGMEIKTRLQELGKSAYWLAKQTSMSEATIGRLINGQRKPSIETLAKLQNVLRWRPKDLMNIVVAYLPPPL